MSQSPAQRHWCWPGLASPHPAHHHWGWPWFGIFLLFFTSFFSSPSSSLAAPPAGIQSDSDPKWSSACYFSAGCCHGTVQSDLLYPSLWKKARAPSGRPPWAFSRSPLDFLLAGSLFFLLTKDMDKSPWCLKRVWSPPSAPPFSLHTKSVWVASGRHYSLFFPNSLPSMCCSFHPSSSWVATACTGDDFRDASSPGATDCVSGFPPFGHLFYNGLAGPRYLLEKNIWEDSECCSLHALSFVSRGFTKSWVGQVALRSPINRHAVDPLWSKVRIKWGDVRKGLGRAKCFKTEYV